MDFDRRDMLGVATALFGSALAAPLSRAFAQTAAPAPGFTASRALFTADQKKLVGAISERIMPTTDTPGAIAAGVPDFIEMMLVDWYEAADRTEFLTGIGVIDGRARLRFAREFAGITPYEQDEILTTAMNRQIPALPAAFFEHCRQLVLTGYFTSEVGCKQERVYVPVPGRYDGRYPYDQVRRIFSS